MRSRVTKVPEHFTLARDRMGAGTYYSGSIAESSEIGRPFQEIVVGNVRGI